MPYPTTLNLPHFSTTLMKGFYIQFSSGFKNSNYYKTPVIKNKISKNLEKLNLKNF